MVTRRRRIIDNEIAPPYASWRGYLYILKNDPEDEKYNLPKKLEEKKRHQQNNQDDQHGYENEFPDPSLGDLTAKIMHRTAGRISLLYG